jgi:hypothetical protein
MSAESSAPARRTVWAIPLASKGFVPVDADSNPVRWFIADYETGKVIDTKPHASMQDAEAQARRNGWNVTVGTARFRFRFWTGPTQVDAIAERLNASPDFTAQAGTEHVYGFVRMLDGGWPAQEFSITAKAALGFDPGFAHLQREGGA